MKKTVQKEAPKATSAPKKHRTVEEALDTKFNDVKKLLENVDLRQLPKL